MKQLSSSQWMVEKGAGSKRDWESHNRRQAERNTKFILDIPEVRRRKTCQG